MGNDDFGTGTFGNSYCLPAQFHKFRRGMFKAWSFNSMLATVMVAATVFSNKIMAELQFDENDSLSANYLLHTASPLCNDSVAMLDHRIPLTMTSEHVYRFFGDDPATCSAVCVQKGTHLDHLYDALPKHIGINLTSINTFADENCQQVEVGFISYHSSELELYFMADDHERIKVAVLEYGERNTLWITSYLGHRLQVIDPSTHESIFNVTVQHDAIYSVGELAYFAQEQDVVEGVSTFLSNEWTRSQRVSRTFTELGFSKSTLPADVWASMSAYYYNNRANTVREEWDAGDFSVNWWEQESRFIHIPLHLKRMWHERLRPLAEEWAGVPLESTDIYGMRQYQDGARLLTHVDRHSTHVVSIIVNIAQGGVRTPWKVEIYDFANRLHEVAMDPGDIVFYESARCLHGRMCPLDGGYYVNLFAHYRPVGDPLWFNKPNFVSRTGGGGDQQTAPHSGHRADAAKCSADSASTVCDEKASPHLSPSQLTLQGPADLFSYWEKTMLIGAEKNLAETASID